MSSHLGDYVRRFGLSRGGSLYFRTKLSRGDVALHLPDVAYPLTIRGGSSDRSAFNEVFVKRWYDQPYPGAPAFIIDAGANVGCTSVRLAHLYPAARVVAVEPDAENHALLLRNVSYYRGVTAVRGAVWPRSTQLAIENPDAKPWAFRVREARPGENGFPAVSIAALLRESGFAAIDILKLDVEGAERELFADPSCQAWLARTNMLFVELHDRIKPGCSDAFERAIALHDFERRKVGSNMVLTRMAMR